MLRKCVSALAVLALLVGITLADEMFGVITKVDGDKVTFAPFKDKQKGDEKTYTAAKDVKVVKGKFDKETKKVEAGDTLDSGLKNELFTKIGEKGVFAQIITDDDKIKEIRVVRFGGKKKKDQ